MPLATLSFMMPRVPSLLLAFASASLACGACGGRGDAPAGSRTRPPPAVIVTTVTTRDVAVTVRAPVELRPLTQAEVGSKTLGYLDAVLVDRGDAVKRGQLLALVRPSDLPDQLVAARGSLAQAQASVALARENAARAKQLAPSGVVSQQELQQSQAALASAEAQEAAAKAQVGAYATRLGETQITAPLDGFVTARKLDPGALVGPTSGGSILTVARTDVLRVFVTVTEREAPLVKVGQKAFVTLDALPDTKIEGTVARLAPTLDPGTRTLDAEVQVQNKEGVLRPGMFGRGAVVVAVHPAAVVVPASSVLVSNGKRWAFVLEGDKVKRREVVVGVDEGDALELVKGVVAGETIVTAGMDNVSDGTTVRASRTTVTADSGAPTPATASSGK